MIFEHIYTIRKVIEAWYPFALALASFGWLVLFPCGWLNLETCKLLASQCVSIHAVFLGFVFASIATLLGLSEKNFVRGMKQSGALAQLICYHVRGLTWSAAGLASGVAMQFCPDYFFHPGVGAAFVAVGIGAMLATWRIVSLFFRLLKYLEFI